MYIPLLYTPISNCNYQCPKLQYVCVCDFIYTDPSPKRYAVYDNYIPGIYT